MQVCRDLETFAGPGNRFLPGKRSIRWVAWAHPNWKKAKREKILQGGPLQCKEYRFVARNKKSTEGSVPWPEMPVEEDKICELWEDKKDEVVLPRGWYSTYLVALDNAPRWSEEEVAMMKDAFFFQECRISSGRPARQLKFRPPQAVIDAGMT